MADLTVTPAQVLKGANAEIESGRLAGEVIDAGESVYLKASDQKWWLADNGTAAEAAVKGIALASATVAGQPIDVQKGGTITIGAGASVTAGLILVASANGGKLAAVADVTSGLFMTVIGIADASDGIKLGIFTGAAHA